MLVDPHPRPLSQCPEGIPSEGEGCFDAVGTGRGSNLRLSLCNSMPFPVYYSTEFQIKQSVAHDFQRILIVRTDRIGDVILTLPMAEALKRRFPTSHIGMLIQRYTAEIVEGNRAVDQTLFYDDGKRPIPFFHLIASLRTQRFDAVFHTHPRFRLALVTWFAGIPVRVGTGYRWYSFFFNRKVYEHRKDAKRHELEYNLNLLKAIDCPVDDKMIAPSIEVQPHVLDRVRALLSQNGVRKDECIVILHPGSGNSARDWSPENFGKLGQSLAQLPNVRIIITGGASEQRLVHDVQSRVGHTSLAMVNQLNLKEFAALAKLATLFIANSTGPLHIAAAVGTAVIGLYPQIKPLSAERWGPYTSKKTILSPAGKPVDCTICRQGKNPCECMASIKVEDVYQAASKYLVN